MAQITYANKVALNENASVPAINKVRDADMNEIKQVINQNETKILLAVSDTAPSECSTGDVYFNTTTNLLYTATATDTWGTTGVAPTSNTIYLELTNQTAYAYNGTTLVSVGGGASGGGGDTTPIGTVEAYAGSSAPNGYLLCDGSAISRTTYSDLFSIIGTTYGTGDGSTTFNLPNIKGKVVVMQDTSDTDFDTLGETGGSKTDNLSNAYALNGSATLSGNDSTNVYKGKNQTFTGNYITNGGSSGSGQAYAGTGYVTELGGTVSKVQPYIVLNYIIKANKISEVPETATVQNVSSNSQTDTYSCDYVNNHTPNAQILWTNPNPTSAFSAQIITLSSSDYDVYECIYAIDKDITDRLLSCKSIKGKGFILSFYDGYEKKGAIRSITYTNDTKLTAQQSYYEANGSSNYCIPLYIIGYKTGLFN